MARRFTLVLLLALLVAVISGCGAVSAHTAAPTPTATVAPAPTATTAPGPPTPTNVPAGWQVYTGTHFTIAYPANWTHSTSPHQQGLQGEGLVLSSPEHTGIITVVESYGYSQSALQSWCHFSGTYRMLAGIRMQFVIGEGDIRYWSFANSNSVLYDLSAFDMRWPPEVQALDDSILATFRPDNATPLCTQ